jgi:hypothetical protein
LLEETAVTTPQYPPRRFDVIPTDDLKRCWDWYAETFEDINRRAVLAHLVPEQDFVDCCLDDRIQKWLVVDDAGSILGMAMLTNDLAAQHVIAPEYFAYHHPEQYAARAIWYNLFVGTTRRNDRAGQKAAPREVFKDLVTVMQQEILATRGFVVIDFCAWNEDVRHLPETTRLLLERLYPDATHRRLDVQSFWAFAPTGEGLA